MYQTLYLGLGTNLGNKEINLKNALKDLSDDFGKPIKVSSIYESKPWGFESENSFYNLVANYRSTLKPQEILTTCQNIEIKLGRKRKAKGYESRIIDIDILLLGNLIIDETNLKIPHPFIEKRIFVLEPLLEICKEKEFLNKYKTSLKKIKTKEKLKKLKLL